MNYSDHLTYKCYFWPIIIIMYAHMALVGAPIHIYRLFWMLNLLILYYLLPLVNFYCLNLGYTISILINMLYCILFKVFRHHLAYLLLILLFIIRLLIFTVFLSFLYLLLMGGSIFRNGSQNVGFEIRGRNR